MLALVNRARLCGQLKQGAGGQGPEIHVHRLLQHLGGVLLDGQIDVATSARKTPERMELFLFSLPLALNNTILSVQEDNTAIVSGEYGTYDGMTVGLLAGNSQNQLLPEFAEKNAFTCQTREYGSNRQLEAALQSEFKVLFDTFSFKKKY